MDIGAVVALGVSVAMGAMGASVAAIVYVVRLEGRVDGHEQRHKDHERRHNEMYDAIKYVRDRIDRALNGHGKSE